MRGLVQVLDLRHDRKAPSVMVSIVDKAQPHWSATNAFNRSMSKVEVTTTDDLGSIDWRPLHGLEVHLQNFSDRKTILRAVARRIADVAPKVLRVCDCEHGDPILHVLEASAWQTIGSKA